MSGCDVGVPPSECVAAPFVWYSPILLDVQLIQTAYGYFIKEMAYKTISWSAKDNCMWQPIDRSLHYVCYRHDPSEVPIHRTVEVNGSVCDRYTGLKISCGDEPYSDDHVLSELGRFSVIYVKGNNKKRVLKELFARNNYNGTNQAVPLIVNVDSATMDEEDSEFCRGHVFGGAADFSFKFVYRRFPVYLKLVSRRDDTIPADTPIFLSNVIVGDRRYDPLALGRPVWICPHDHTCGQKWFSSQRCAALNVGLLETLWSQMRNNEYRELLKIDNRTRSTARNRHDVERYLQSLETEKTVPYYGHERRRRDKAPL